MHEDLRTALRSLRSSPTFTAVALAVLALGIGAGTAIFSVVDAVVLRGLPFDQHDRLVAVLEHDAKRPTTFGRGATTTQTFLDWRRLQTSFDGLAAAASTRFRTRTATGEPAQVRAQRVSAGFLDVLRVAPLVGRPFTSEDETAGRNRVVILSYGFWQRHFGGAPDVLGRTLDLDEESWEIVGVMPRTFEYPVGSDRPSELYVPILFDEAATNRGNGRNYNYTAIGRLADGVTIAQATDQVNAVAAALGREYPKWSPGRDVEIKTLHEHLVGRVRSWMLMLLGAVGLVLVIACANVANLMLARATVRGREIGVRAALGASRWRLVRGLLVEGLALSLAGAALGVGLAYLGVQVLTAWLPPGLPRVATIGIDFRVLGAAVVAAFATGALFSVVPAFQASRPDLTAVLRDGGRSATAGRAGHRLRSALVVAEVALAVLLLVGAGLFTGSFVQLVRVDPGFDYRHVLTEDVHLRYDPAHREELFARGPAFVTEVLEAVRRVPGVEQAGGVNGGLPLTGSWSRNSVTLPGRGKLEGDDDSIDYRQVTPDYLSTLRIPLLKGRLITADDGAGTEPVVVVNQAAARKYWPGEDALGQRITISDTERRVVGIVGDIRHLGPETPPRQEAYVPFVQSPTLGATLAIRTAGDPLAVLPAVKAAIRSVDPDQLLAQDTVTLEGYMDRLIAQRRFNMALLVIFGVLGLVIAVAGIYGVMAYLVAQRTNEIGVRMALGATAGRVLGMVLGRSAALMAAGLTIGAVAAWYLSASVRAFLFEVEPADPRILLAAVATLAAAGLVASAVPARRAARVDPMVALRHE